MKSGGNFVVKAGSCWPGQRPERPRHRDQSRAVATSSCLFGLFLSLLPFFLLWSREMFSPFLFLGSRKMINESNRGPSRHSFWGQTKYQNKVRVNLAFFSSQTRSMAFSFLGYEASCYLQSFKFVFKVPNCHKGWIWQNIFSPCMYHDKFFISSLLYFCFHVNISINQAIFLNVQNNQCNESMKNRKKPYL